MNAIEIHMDDDEKKRQHPTPEINPITQPVPQELPPAESPQPEIEPYQTPATPTPDMPQPEA